MLLFRGRDASAPDRGSWWFTPGGGLDAGESPREAALREVREETGLALSSVSGPVFEQEIDFAFEDIQLHQYEQFFVAWVTAFDVTHDGGTELEKRSMLESRWWSLAELEATTETIYPAVLAELVRVQLTQ
ncbi:hypothetical protein GCM10022239_22200 [Leifsonia bigeumensis]|uniref:Nudix hydrolase domain-containing protein n=1 Tax=Leifsonella bigeumensis TaxID=433643 RepID=A0ABP7FXC8_9MICO